MLRLQLQILPRERPLYDKESIFSRTYTNKIMEETENLSLQDEEDQLSHVVPQFFNSPGSCEPTPYVSPTQGIEPPQSSQEEIIRKQSYNNYVYSRF